MVTKTTTIWFACGLAAIVLLASHAEADTNCDIIVHVKSATNTPFQAQVTSPGGTKSNKWTFTQNRQQETYQQKHASDCTTKDWQVTIFDEAGKTEKGVSKISLSGVGTVRYEVGDDLKPVQKERQGAVCGGDQCAPLATAVKHTHHN